MALILRGALVSAMTDISLHPALHLGATGK